MNNIVQKRVLKPMTDKELERYIGPKKIVKYSDLDDYYNNIYDLLPLAIDFRIILFETDLNSGHWVCVIRNDIKKEMVYFDSYGNQLGSLFVNNSKKSNFDLGNKPNAILALFATRKKYIKLIVNRYSFQSITNGAETCGRWCILFIKFNLDYDVSLSKFYDFVNNKQNNMNFKDLDEVAAYYIV
jgi:hypothetical protein